MESYIEADISNWTEEVSKSTILTVVYFWHEQCAYCMRLNPIFNGIAREYVGKVKLVKLNVLGNSANREIAVNHGVMGTPTMMFFCNSRPVGRMVGLMSNQELESLMNDMFRRYERCFMQSTDLRGYIV